MIMAVVKFGIVLVTLIMIKAAESTTAGHPVPPFSCGSSKPYYTFCNRDLPISERARDLVSRLTVDEKVSQLINEAPAIPRLGIPNYLWSSEALHGVVSYIVDDCSLSLKTCNTRTATSFPQVILTAATFDAHLWYRIAKAIGTEARALYNEGLETGMTFWSPNINIYRDPRWGRGQETPGEDPFLTSKYAVSFVRGIQGDSYEGGELKDGHLLASACCKHFAVYDLDIGKGYSRYTFDARVTKQDMADTYQPPLKSCVQEGAASGIMCASNLVNGVPSCADYDLLTKTARGEWGFQGYITSDYNAVKILIQQNYSKSHEDSVAVALKAGLDVECGFYLANHTKSALEKGKVSESDIDRALHNLFSVRMRLGHFNGNPSGLTYGNLSRNDVCSDEHQDLALEAARHGIVLLKNYANLLPLSKAKTKSLAVIGPNANVSEALLGDFSSSPCKTVTPLQGLMNYVKQINFHKGCDTIHCTSIALREAVKIAQTADYVVLVMGLNQDRERENLDREDLVLPGEQQSLITSIAKEAKKPVILVLLCGGPVDISFAKDDPNIGGILWAGYPGEAGGRAIAEILFGDHNPGGRLPVTWYPKDFINIPITDMRMRPDASSGYPGRTYKFYEGEKVFEFGYGLSYSNYSYKFVHVSQSKINFKLENPGDVSVASSIGFETCDIKAKFSVIVSVENEGEMGGKHSVLLFLKRDEALKGSPIKQLVGFQTVRLDAKEKANVEFQVNPCQHFTSASEDGTMVIQSGAYHLIVGDQEYPLQLSPQMFDSNSRVF